MSSIHEDRKRWVDEERQYVLDQIAHMRARSYRFDEWVVLFVLANPNDQDGMKMARLVGWKEGGGDSFYALVRRDELCEKMRANEVLDAGLIEQTIHPGKLRCVVFDRGVGIVDLDVPVSTGN